MYNCSKGLFRFGLGLSSHDMREAKDSAWHAVCYHPTAKDCNWMWEFPKIMGTLFGGPQNKEYHILGSILGSHYVGKLPCRVWGVMMTTSQPRATEPLSSRTN